MNKRQNLARLSEISRLTLDIKLAALNVAAQKRQHSLDLLQNLTTPLASPDISAVAAHQAALRYQTWAEARRAEINISLARQTAEMHVARDAAGQAFGKDQALRGLRSKLG